MQIDEIIQPPPQNPAPAQPAVQQPVRQKLLVVVHPGSACGSADFNLGRYEARADREYLAQDIAAWNGPILVIDGQLSDELPHYPQLDSAIKGTLARAKANKQLSLRLYGDDDAPPHQEDTARKFIKQQKLNPAEWEIELTGAWMTEDTGCVRGVWKVFQAAGFPAEVRESALWLRDEEDDWERPRDNW